MSAKTTYSDSRPKVLIAGIGGASLGTELLKCLLMANRYRVFGCDISPFATGHYQQGFEATFIVNRQNYIESLLELCEKHGIDIVVPGADETTIVLTLHSDELAVRKIKLAANKSEVVQSCSDKAETFRMLSSLGFAIPHTIIPERIEDYGEIDYPCIVKPATGSGGSVSVFLATNREEAALYCEHIRSSGKVPLLQEYVSEAEGEYTIGVLSLPDQRMIGSIALRRFFNSKLSVLAHTPAGPISSGYSQGLIEPFDSICRQAEEIATALGSRGPLNIQCRIRGGKILSFEINPRFSASTFLRAMAGFNEIDLFIRYLTNSFVASTQKIRLGYYLRSLSEVFVPCDGLKR